MSISKEKLEQIKKNPNEFILETYSKLKTVSEALKETKNDLQSLAEEDQELLELISQLEEKKAEIKPLAEKLKTKKAEFKVANIAIFEQEQKLKNKVSALKADIANAFAYKESIDDRTPIILNDGKKQKQLIVEITSKVKKGSI